LKSFRKENKRNKANNDFNN